MYLIIVMRQEEGWPWHILGKFQVSGNKGVEKDNIVTQQGMKSVSSVSLQTVEFYIVNLHRTLLDQVAASH